MTLVSHVHIVDERGESHIYAPDDEVPEWAARKMGAHCFEGGQHPYPDEADGPVLPDREFGVEPPRAGRGATRDAWLAYAAEKGVPVPTGAGRDEIVAAIVAALDPTFVEEVVEPSGDGDDLNEA